MAATVMTRAETEKLRHLARKLVLDAANGQRCDAKLSDEDWCVADMLLRDVPRVEMACTVGGIGNLLAACVRLTRGDYKRGRLIDPGAGSIRKAA